MFHDSVQISLWSFIFQNWSNSRHHDTEILMEYVDGMNLEGLEKRMTTSFYVSYLYFCIHHHHHYSHQYPHHYPCRSHHLFWRRHCLLIFISTGEIGFCMQHSCIFVCISFFFGIWHIVGYVDRKSISDVFIRRIEVEIVFKWILMDT